MNEAEWLGGDDPVPMLSGPVVPRSGRRERLVACACCRRLWDLLAEGSRHAVEVTEHYADGRATSDDLWDAYHATETAMNLFGHVNEPVYRLTHPDDQFDVLEVVDHAAEAADGEKGMASEWAAQAKIVREVFGNPFHRIVMSTAWLDWNDQTVPKLARAVYEERAFDRLPILADALEEAGCTERAILDHLRGPGPHCRGCWALDLLRPDYR